MLNVAYSKFYNPSEHLAIDEVIVLFKGKVAFKQYIPEKHKRFGIKIYKLCDRTGHKYDLEVYLGKDRIRATTDVTVTHATVKQVTRRVQGRGHKLYMDNYFSSPDLYNELTKQKINCHGTERPNCKGRQDDFRSKKLKLKRGDVKVRTSGDMTAVVWKDKGNVHMLTNMRDPPAEVNFCDESGNTLKPEIVEHYNQHMGYVDKGDRMANSYSISRRTCKWTKKLFFHFLDLTVLNSYILLTSCGPKLSHRDFRLTIVRDMVEVAGPQPRPQQCVGRPSVLATRIGRLEESSLQHWPTTTEKRMDCVVCHARTKKRL
jgi:hypothetical protein